MNETPYANSVFEQPWWLDIVAPGKWHEAIVRDKDGRTIARMPYVTKGKRVLMPPFTQNIGIWMAPEVFNSYSEQKKVLFEIFQKISNYKSVQCYLSPANQYVLPLRWLGYQLEPAFSYRLTDLSDCNALYQKFEKTAKKNIRYAQNKTKLFDELNLERLLEMLDKTFEAQHRKNPMDKSMVSRIVLNCEKTGHGKYLEARDAQGNVHSCAYFVYDQQACYYLLGASDSRFRSSGAQSLILWEGIQFAARNSAIFDFEGSMVEGIEHFFRQFGGACTPYYCVRRVSFLNDILLAAKPRVKRLLGYKI